MLKLYRLCVKVARESQLPLTAGCINQAKGMVLIGENNKNGKILGYLTENERTVEIDGTIVCRESR